jgi:branched-subunit amino acid transport protein
MNEVILIAGMALVTFGIRYPVLAILGRLDLPERVFQALRFVPVAVLTAIILPEMLIRKGEFVFHYTNAYLVAGIVAGIIAWRSKNLLLTIVIGMGFFLLWRAIIGAA